MKIKKSTIGIVICSWIIFFLVCFFVFSKLSENKNDHTKDNTTTTATTEVTSATTGTSTSEATTATAKVVIGADIPSSKEPELKAYMDQYYDALNNQDLDTLKPMVKDYDLFYENYQKLITYVEKYDDIEYYMVQGATDHSFVIYATYKLKIKNIDTLVPGLRSYYISFVGGKYNIYNNESTDTKRRSNARKTCLNQPKVQALVQKANEEYEQAVASDPQLQEFFNEDDAQ